MKRIILLSLLSIFSQNCLETSSKSLQIPGSLIPTHENCSPLGPLKLALKESSIHGSREEDILRSLTKNAKAHFYEALAADLEIKKQCAFLDERFKTANEQIKYLCERQKKLKNGQDDEIAQVEIDLLVHKMDACSLHMALMVAQGTKTFES